SRPARRRGREAVDTRPSAPTAYPYAEMTTEVPVSDHTAILGADGIHKFFGSTPALRGASVTVYRGEVLAVMGPSGSGKSTLLHCLAGIFTPDRGEVRYDGQRIDQLGEARRTELRRTAFGFVFQFGQLVPELTALDNVALPLLLNKT